MTRSRVLSLEMTVARVTVTAGDGCRLNQIQVAPGQRLVPALPQSIMVGAMHIPRHRALSLMLALFIALAPIIGIGQMTGEMDMGQPSEMSTVDHCPSTDCPSHVPCLVGCATISETSTHLPLAPTAYPRPLQETGKASLTNTPATPPPQDL
jgi:hypothetical protein